MYISGVVGKFHQVVWYEFSQKLFRICRKEGTKHDGAEGMKVL